MPKLYNNPTADIVLESQIQKIGPSVCKKNLRRDRDHPLECACKKGLRWPYCRKPIKGLKDYGFEIKDD